MGSEGTAQWGCLKLAVTWPGVLERLAVGQNLGSLGPENCWVLWARVKRGGGGPEGVACVCRIQDACAPTWCSGNPLAPGGDREGILTLLEVVRARAHIGRDSVCSLMPQLFFFFSLQNNAACRGGRGSNPRSVTELRGPGPASQFLSIAFFLTWK